MRFVSIVILTLLYWLPSLSQDYNYVNYDTKDGLAGSTVYCMTQDVDGFKWFGTESGLSRFDGSRFVNFTVANGLPDNEVLEILGDNKGRVWISTFSKQVCYYYKGKIYNPENTPWLKNFRLIGPITKIIIDSKGNLAFSDYFSLYWLDTNDKLTNLSDKPEFKKHLFRGHFVSDFDRDDNLILSTRDSIYLYKEGILKALEKQRFPQAVSGQIALYNGLGSPVIELEEPNVLQKIAYTNHRATFVATSNGAWAIDTINNKLGAHFLPGTVISEVFEGFEKNLWFATMGNGIYKLPSRETRTIHFKRKGKEANNEVFSLMYWQNKFFCGLNFSESVLLNNNMQEVGRIDLKDETINATNNFASNRQLCSLVFDDHTAFLGFDAFLVKLVNGRIAQVGTASAVKSIDKIDEEYILMGNHAGAYKIRVTDMKVIDTIWRGRVTKAIYHHSGYYIGTTNGLFHIQSNGVIDTLANTHPTLSRRITAISTQGQVVWVGSSDKGIVGLKNGKPLIAINSANGLSSDICKSLTVNNDNVWVGTDKGLNKINFSKGLLRIIKFGLYDGLPSETINAILEKDSLVYIATPEGLTYFNESKLSFNSLCQLRLLGMRYPNGTETRQGTLYIPYNENRLGIDYTAISFRSAGDIKYYYRLQGLSNKWQMTRNTNLEFPALPSGRYLLQLQAVNRFGIKSEIIAIPFVVITPFWKTWWFLSLSLFLLVLITAGIVHYRNSIAKSRMQQHLEVEMKLAELEQQALQAQMNPHFIFNCLNSIQQYFLTNDGEKANKFLSMFAALVRETLHFSSQKSIRVSDEVRYLSRYLEMEKMRFGDHFDYEISVDPNLQANYAEIPALMLQPYVENAIRHGVRHRKNGNGKIRITFAMEGEELHCIVADNGIGRENSKTMRGRQPVEYQSRGMELGEKRIEALNKLYQRAIKVEIKDLKDVHGQALGTEVHLIIPV